MRREFRGNRSRDSLPKFAWKRPAAAASTSDKDDVSRINTRQRLLVLNDSLTFPAMVDPRRRPLRIEPPFAEK